MSLLKQRSTVLRFLYHPSSKTGRQAAGAATVAAVGFLVFLDGDNRLDAVLPQVGAVAGGGVGLVRHRAAGPAAGPAQAAPLDADRVHQRDEPGGVAVLAGAGQPGNGAAAQVSGQVDLGGQPAAGAANPFPARFLVIRWSPLCGHQQPVHGGPRPRADGPG